MCGNVNTVLARQYHKVSIFICNKYDIPASTQQNCCMSIIGFISNQSQSWESCTQPTKLGFNLENHDGKSTWKTCSDMYLTTNFVQIFNLTFNTRQKCK